MMNNRFLYHIMHPDLFDSARFCFENFDFKITLNDVSKESRKWSLFKAGRSHVEQLGRRLYQAPLLAFHTAT